MGLSLRHMWAIQYKTLLMLNLHRSEGLAHSTNSSVLLFSPWQLRKHTNVQQPHQGHKTMTRQTSMPGSFSRTLTLPSPTLDRKLLCGRNKCNPGRGEKSERRWQEAPVLINCCAKTVSFRSPMVMSDLIFWNVRKPE